MQSGPNSQLIVGLSDLMVSLEPRDSVVFVVNQLPFIIYFSRTSLLPLGCHLISSSLLLLSHFSHIQLCVTP